MTFVPGQSGNPTGKPKSAKLFRDALLVAIKQADAQGVEAVQRVAFRLVAEAEAGDVSAIREIADRIDGKVPQAIGGTDELDPLVVQIIRRANDSTPA